MKQITIILVTCTAVNVYSCGEKFCPLKIILVTGAGVLLAYGERNSAIVQHA